jgi:hypothetical protein
MEKIKEDLSWGTAFILLAILALLGAAIKFGAMTLVLSHELEKSECAATYWKARTQGNPSNYCPPGCECDVRVLR